MNLSSRSLCGDGLPGHGGGVPADEHFVPGLRSEAHPDVRVGIVRVIGGVIEDGGTQELRPLGHRFWLF